MNKFTPDDNLNIELAIKSESVCILIALISILLLLHRLPETAELQT